MDQGKKLTQLILNKLERDINLLYIQASKEIKKELKKYPNFDRMLSIKDKNERLRTAKRRSDFQLLIKKLAKILQVSNSKSVSLIQDKMIDIFILNYDFEAYKIEKESMFNLSYRVFSKEAIKLLLKEETPVFTKMAYSGIKDLNTIIRDLKLNLYTSIRKGESINQIAKRIDKVTDKNNNGSIRIARTETTRIENSGRLEAIKHGEDMGLNLKKQWISTIDSKTRDRHLELNMKIVDTDKSFAYGLKYPGDPHATANQTINCRCTVVSVLQDYTPTNKELELDMKLRELTFEQWRKRNE